MSISSYWSYNVVLSMLAATVVIIPGAAVRTRRFRNASSVPAQGMGCENKPTLESYLDAFSWNLYRNNAGNLSLPHVQSHGSDQMNLSNVAAESVMRFVRAARTYNLSMTANKSVAVVGTRNRSRNEVNHAAESAYCCHHLPNDDPYWGEVQNYDQTHPGYIKCQYSDNCQRHVTNTMRVDSIRRALAGSKALFHKLGIQSLLYGGSAIGQYRCGDVIPWDVDCDFIVGEASIYDLHEKVFGTKADFNNWKAGETSVDLADFGAPGLRLIKKTPCAPFEIVDTQEGFFCDVFTSKWRSHELYTPWWSAPHLCHGLFNECANAGGSQHCYKFPAAVVTPPQSCEMSGVVQGCPPDLPSFLHAVYGSGWQTPNQTIHIRR